MLVFHVHVGVILRYRMMPAAAAMIAACGIPIAVQRVIAVCRKSCKRESSIPGIHAPGARRPREELPTLAVLALCRLFVDVTGLSHHKHVKTTFDVVFGKNLGKVSEAVIRQRVSREPPPFWIKFPPLNKLGGQRADRRPWTLWMTMQAAAGAHEIERQWLASHHKANVPRKTAKPRRVKFMTAKDRKEIQRRMEEMKARR